MKTRPGRPKSVSRGTQRRTFLWVGPDDTDHSHRFCTVTWMRHGKRLAAVAQYRDVSGIDMAYLGMAQGEIGGPMLRIGEERAATVLGLIGHDPKAQHDSIDAVMALAVISLEAAVRRAVAGDAEDDEPLHPWTAEGRAEYDARAKAGKAVPK
jgi:hypothetical protein